MWSVHTGAGVKKIISPGVPRSKIKPPHYSPPQRAATCRVLAGPRARTHTRNVGILAGPRNVPDTSGPRTRSVAWDIVGYLSGNGLDWGIARRLVSAEMLEPHSTRGPQMLDDRTGLAQRGGCA
jgi:hypothetical protein